MVVKTWNIEAITGYKPITTFYEDFSIADRFGARAVKDTYYTAFKNWKTNYKYLTELVMALNWKIYEHYNCGNEKLANLYDELFTKAHYWAIENLTGDELAYYIQTTD